MSCWSLPLNSYSLLLVAAAFAGAPATTQTTLQAGYDQMYNLQFDRAHQTFAAYEREHPNDPMGPVSDAAAYLFSEFNRLGILQSQFLTNNAEVLNSHRLTEDLALIQKRELSALKEIKLGRETAQQLLDAHPDYQDAYIAMGVENYLLSLKPAPLRWILRATGSQTDRDIGVMELRKTAADGKYLAPYAKVLLAVAALRRGDQQEAKTLLTWLSGHYPGNPLYRSELAKLH